MNKKKKIKNMLETLVKAYPDAKIVLKFSSPWELVVAVILSARCTDEVVNRVTAKLFKKYKTLEDYTSISLNEFERDIKSTGFFRMKAKNILKSANIIKNKYLGTVPSTMEELLKLPGVARKTANIILVNAFQKVEGIAVDTHVFRVSQRLRIVNLDKIGGKNTIMFGKAGKKLIDYKKNAYAEKIEKELMAVIPKGAWVRFTYAVIEHGRRTCKARNPICKECRLSKYCPSCR